VRRPPRSRKFKNFVGGSAVAPAETKQKALDTASSQGGRCPEPAEESRDEPPWWRVVADTERTRAAGGLALSLSKGTACRPFFAPSGDWDVPAGFAKNG